jgi:hypothetical protein
MFGSTALEVAIGVVFLFMAAALMCTAAVEIIATALELRAKTLEQALTRMLGDKWSTIRDHGLLKTLGRADSKAPSYIPPDLFAGAVMARVLGESATGSSNFATIRDSVAKLANPQLKEALLALVTAAESVRDDSISDLAKVENQIERWYSDTMKRVSGWYKRRAQWITCGVALVLVTVLNLDTVNFARALARDDLLRAKVVQAAEAAPRPAAAVDSAAIAAAASAALPPPTPQETLARMAARRTEMVQTADQLIDLGLPIGWKTPDERMMDTKNDEADLRYPPTTPGGWITKVFGLLATALAATLGAPFWFDLLNKLITIRGTGKAPEETPKPPKEQPKPRDPQDTP